MAKPRGPAKRGTLEAAAASAHLLEVIKTSAPRVVIWLIVDTVATVSDTALPRHQVIAPT